MLAYTYIHIPTHTLAGARGQRQTSDQHVIKVQAALDLRDKRTSLKTCPSRPELIQTLREELDAERAEIWYSKSYDAFFKLFVISRAEREAAVKKRSRQHELLESRIYYVMLSAMKMDMNENETVIVENGAMALDM